MLSGIKKYIMELDLFNCEMKNEMKHEESVLDNVVTSLMSGWLCVVMNHCSSLYLLS